MNATVDGSTEEQIAQWRSWLRHRQAIHGRDIEELEGHLRDQLAALTTAGLSADEAFLVAVRRMGNLDALAREFAQAHSERLWKQLVVTSASSNDERHAQRKETFVVLGLALAAAVLIKIPGLFGYGFDGSAELFYACNASLFVLPLLTIYLLWKRAQGANYWLALPFVAAAVFANAYPVTAGSDTGILLALHLPIALWLVVGCAYVRGRWFPVEGRMDFVRFSGELAIYCVLIALGGLLFTAVTMMMFKSIGMQADWLAQDWIVPCGACALMLIGAWLVEAKQSVIENMAPVLTRLFTPLFTLLFLAFLVTMGWTGRPIDVGREVLIGFDLLLVLVVGLVLYSISARDPQAPPDLFDRLQLLLVGSALAVDVLALVAIATRISEFGFTPNRVAALGENLILLVNLAGSAWFHLRFLRGNGTFAALERWHVAYLPAYALWAALVVIVFPPAFGYR